MLYVFSNFKYLLLNTISKMEKLFLRSKAALDSVFLEYHRPLFHKIDWSNPFSAIIGARGVGKTTLLIQRLAALGLPPHHLLSLIFPNFPNAS